ncbi:MAG: HAMP domain-containing protein [Candidatus Riflebacteria bacterium]|nr:HAMP domain-containing protein [Candidatus Riflebacteria bacterium]
MLRRQSLFIRILAWFAGTVLVVTAVTATMIWYLYEEAADLQLANAIDLLHREGGQAISRLEATATGRPAVGLSPVGSLAVGAAAACSAPRRPSGEEFRPPFGEGTLSSIPSAAVTSPAVTSPAPGEAAGGRPAAGPSAPLPTGPLPPDGASREIPGPSSPVPPVGPPGPPGPPGLGDGGFGVAPARGPRLLGHFPIWVFDDLGQLVCQPPAPPFPPGGPGSRDVVAPPGFAGSDDPPFHPGHHRLHGPSPEGFDPGPPPFGNDPAPSPPGFDPGPPPGDFDPGPPPAWPYPDGGSLQPPASFASFSPSWRRTGAGPRSAGPAGFRPDAGGFAVRRPGRPPLEVSQLASAARDFLAASASPRLVEIDGDDFLCAGLTGPSGRAYVGMLLFRPPPLRLVQRLLTTPALGVRVLIVLGVVALLCWLLARTLVGPVLELRGFTRSISAGEFHSRLPGDLAGRGDELGDLARDFNRMADTIERVLQHQRQLLRDVSHELRSPLARVQIALELLRQKAGGASDDLVGKIGRDLGRLNELIQQILDLSRFEQVQAVPLQLEIVDLATVVRQVVGDVQFEADLTGKRIAAAIPDDAVPVAAAPEFLRRAVENVLRNAVRHTPDGTRIDLAVEVGVEGVPGSLALPMVTVRVRDHGPGVAEADLPRLFDPFFRCEEDRGRQTGGMGLGLAIVQKAIAAHSGTVTARNADGGGLEILLRLPLAKG